MLDSVVNWWKNALFHFFKKYGLYLVVTSILLGIVGGVTYNKVTVTEYTASGQLVQNDNNYNIISSYNQFLKTTKFTNALKKKVETTKWKNEKYSIDMTNSSNSPFFNINAKSSDPKFSIYLVNESMEIFMSKIKRYLAGTNTSRVSSATLIASGESRSKIAKIGLLTFVLVFAVQSLIIFIFTWHFGKIKDDKFINDITGISNFGIMKIN